MYQAGGASSVKAAECVEAMKIFCNEGRLYGAHTRHGSLTYFPGTASF